MSDEIMETEVDTSTTGTETETQVADTESDSKNQGFSKDQVDKIVQDRLAKERRKIDRKLDGVDLDSYRQWEAEKKQAEVDAQKERGEFERVLKSTVENKDAQIDQLRSMLESVQVDGSILQASSRETVAPEQVAQLLKPNVRLSKEGDVEIVDSDGNIRYTEDGDPMRVNDLVNEFIVKNPHFARATPAGAGSGKPDGQEPTKLKLSELDMRDPDDRERYRQYKTERGY